MKALLLVHGLGVGGAETMVAALARHLRDAGDAVEIGCLGALGEIGAELRAEGIPLVVHARRPGFDATLPWRLAQRVRAGGFDVVHAHQRTALFYGLCAGMLHATPLVYTEHGPRDGPRPSAPQRAFNRVIGRRAGRITAVSRDTAAGLAACEGFARRQVTVIPNAIAVERYATAARAGRAAARVRLALPATAPVLGTVGRLDAVKNQQLLLHVLAALRRRRADALLVVVGEGPERAALDAAAGRLGLDGAVRWLGLRRDVEHVLPALDVFCLPSRAEGIPLVLLEAMAAHVPAVASTAGGIGEAARDGVEALLVDGAVPDARAEMTPDTPYVARFAAAVARLLDDAPLRERLVAQAAARVRAEFSTETVCRRYREILVR